MERPDQDLFVTLYELHMGHPAPPRELWDTPAIREVAEAEGHHPMTYWLMGSEVPADPEQLALYDDWMDTVQQANRGAEGL